MHRWLRPPLNHPNLAHLLPRAREERLRRLMLGRPYMLKLLVSIAATGVVFFLCFLLLILFGRVGHTGWTLACMAFTVAVVVGVEFAYERIVLNRTLDGMPRLPCPRCGYSLDSHESPTPVCPECGSRSTEMLP